MIPFGIILRSVRPAAGERPFIKYRLLCRPSWCLVEARYYISQGFKLGSATRNISWGPDPILQDVLIVQDARLFEESLGLATICSSHANLLICWHEVLQEAIFVLLFLLASLLPWVCFVVYLGLDVVFRLLTFRSTIRADLKRLIVLLLLLLKWLYGEVVVDWTFAHSTIFCAFIYPFHSATFFQEGSKLG